MLKGLFSRSKPTETDPVSQVEAPVAPPEGVFSMNHPWPFLGSKPNETHVIELASRTVIEGDHAFYVWGEEKRRHIYTSRGTQSFTAARVVWWLEGRKDPQRINSVRSNCGENACIKIEHLELRQATKPEPTPKTESLSKKVQRELNTPGDRTKCVTAKVWFPNEKKATEAARHRNQPEIRRGRPRLYTYPCPFCDGHHLTKQNPTKRKNRKPKGSW